MIKLPTYKLINLPKNIIKTIMLDAVISSIKAYSIVLDQSDF